MINEKVNYIIKNATLIEWQKWLNQWEHTFLKIEIIDCKIFEGTITIVLKRTNP